MTVQKFVMVQRASELLQVEAITDSASIFVAGTAHIFGQLEKMGVEVVGGDDLIAFADLQNNLEKTSEILTVIEEQLLFRDRALNVTILSSLAKSLLFYFLKSNIERKYNCKFTTIANDGAPWENKFLHSQEPLNLQGDGARFQELSDGLRFRKVLGNYYALDFQSQIGKYDGPELFFQVVTGNKQKRISFLRSYIKTMMTKRTEPQKAKIKVPLLMSSEIPSFELECDHKIPNSAKCFIEQNINTTISVFLAYKSSLQNFLNQNGLPSLANFNHVRDAGVAGFAAALESAGVDCHMKSHGALMSYGTGPRHEVARYLAQAHFNSFPSMTTLATRSPLQVIRHVETQSVVREKRLRPPAETRPRVRKEFNIYYAPNFLPWSQNHWGVSPSCFDSLKCINVLAQVVSNLSDVTLNIRIKTTVADKAVKGIRFGNRALYPEDVEHLINPDQGIFDASVGAHSAFLEEADLVVTEGLTSVMFDALETRKPVLLLNASASAVPSMPSWGVEELMERDGRNAVYSASTVDPLSVVLKKIDDKHRGVELQNSELQEYIWI